MVEKQHDYRDEARCHNEEILHVEERIRGEDLQPHRSGGVDTTVIGVIGTPPYGMLDRMELLPGVERVTPITKPYKLAAREFTALRP